MPSSATVSASRGSSTSWPANRSPPRGSFRATPSRRSRIDTQAILAGGHELACHGWFHEDFSELDAGEQHAILERSFEAATRAAGTPPKGCRAPYWALGRGDAGARRGDRLRLRQLAHGRRLPARIGSAAATTTPRRGLDLRARGRPRRGAGVLGARRLAAVRARRRARPRRPERAVEGPRDLDRASCATPRSTRRAAC